MPQRSNRDNELVNHVVSRLEITFAIDSKDAHFEGPPAKR